MVLASNLESNREGNIMKVETNATVLKVGWISISLMVLLVMVYIFIA